jgi:hypothetical protein
MKKGSILIVFLVIFWGINLPTHAQTDCKCNEINQFQIDQMLDDNDTLKIKQTINKLRKNNRKECQFVAYNLEINNSISRKKLNGVDNIILNQVNLISSLPCRAKLITTTYLNYAKYYTSKEDYENLSKFSFKALESAEINKDEKSEVKAITFIVHLFTRQSQEEKNWAYIKRAEKIINSLNQDYTSAVNFNWLAFEYERKFTLTTRLTLLDTAVIYAQKAKLIALKYKNYTQLARCFRVFESNAYNHKQLKNALSYIDSAIFYAKKTTVPTNLSSLYFAKAWDHLDLKQYPEAIAWQDSSIYHAEKYEHRTPATMNIYGEGAKLFEQAGNLPKSYKAFKIYAHIKDSLFTIKKTEKINELEQRYNKAKNEKTIKELAQQKQIYLLLALAGLLGLVVLGFFIRQQALKSKQQIMETEQRLNRARMNPHFFFNALSSLQAFALQGNDGKSIATNLSKFSHIMRETLESTYKDYVTLEQEIDFLGEYMSLQKMRFPQKFSYTIQLNENIEADETLIPSMILQPFIENCIEHGFVGIDYEGKIMISFNTEAKDLLVIITDNGIGLATTAKEDNEHISRASQIIRDRIFLLNIKLKTKATFSVDNNVNEKGVIVSIKLPLLEKTIA